MHKLHSCFSSITCYLLVAFTIKNMISPGSKFCVFFSFVAFLYIYETLLRCQGGLGGVFYWFYSCFCELQSFLSVKMGKNCLIVFLCFWALFLGFYGHERCQMKGINGLYVRRVIKNSKMPFFRHFLPFEGKTELRTKY